MQSQDNAQKQNQQSIRNNLKKTLNLEGSTRLNELVQEVQPEQTQTTTTNRKIGADRLKIKINFSEEKEETQPVVQQGEIQKQSESFDQKYILGDYLGEGAHAIVRKGWKKTLKKQASQKLYAIKIFRNGDPEIVNTIKKTYINTRFLNHPSIAAAVELFINENTETSYLVQEYCSFPSLESIMKKNGKLPEDFIRNIGKNLIQAVQYIHQKGICHRDIKPDNILVNAQLLEEQKQPTLETQAVKLVDFGVSKRFIQIVPGKVCFQTSDMWTRTGNMYYCAPEIFNGGGYSSSVDLWAIGVVLYQCLTAKLPFLEDTMMDTIEAIRNEGKGQQFEVEEFKSLSKSCQHFIKRILCGKEQRISLEDALEHLFLTYSSPEVNVKNKQKTRDDHDIQKRKVQIENLTKSSQAGLFAHNRLDQSIHPKSEALTIKEETEEDSSPSTKTNFESTKLLNDKLNQFKEENQLDTIHLEKKPENPNNVIIDLVSSFNSYQITQGAFSSSNHNNSEVSISNTMATFLKKLAPYTVNEAKEEDDINTPCLKNCFSSLDNFLTGGIETSQELDQKEYPKNLDLNLEGLGCRIVEETEQFENK